MPLFSDLRSDYPLHLTLLERPYAGALKQSYRAIFCTGSRINFCSSACAPSASESTCGLTQLRASVREFQLHIDEQRTPPVEHRRAHLRGNTELDSRELAASLLSPKSAACVVVAVHMLSTSGRHSPITTVLCRAFQMRNSWRSHTTTRAT